LQSAKRNFLGTMQPCSLLFLALLAAPATSASVFAESAARLWLSQHGAPKRDELAELRTANPEAFAIVKALLSKRSLGLLDPKHPTASFSNQQIVPEASADQESPSWRQLLAPPGGAAPPIPTVSTVALPYAAMPAPPRDWLNWKPQSSVAVDDVIVQNVGGPVADLKDKKLGLLSQSHTVSQQEIPQWAAAAPVIDTPAIKREIPQAAPVKKSGVYKVKRAAMVKLDAIVKRASETAAAYSNPATQAAAYLTGLDLTGDSNAPSSHKKSTPRKSLRALSTSNALQSFSFEDNDDEEPAIEGRSKSKMIAPRVNSKKSLMSWLTAVHNEPEAQKRLPHSSYSSDPKVLEQDKHLLKALLP